MTPKQRKDLARLAARPNLARQKTDFTAEGAPPPGKVSTGTPATEAPLPAPPPAAPKA